MRLYRYLWATTAAVIISPAALFDAIAYGWLRMAVMGLVMALLGGLFALVIAEGRADRWRWARRGVMWAGLGAVAADALVATLGRTGALIGSAILVTSPAVLGSVRSSFLRRSSHRTSGPPEMPAACDLLRRWEWTTAEVTRADLPMSRRLALVEERSKLLDEVERRDPSHFATWMATAVPDGRVDRQRPR